MVLILRRLGRGRWSPARQAEWLTPLEARRGGRITLFGVEYRVSKVEA